MHALRHCSAAKISNTGALSAPLAVRSTVNLSALFFVAALFCSVVVAESDALATSAQSTMGGTYYGATDVLVNANEHLSCPTTLQFDPKTNSATVTVNYRGTDMTTKINGTFRDGVFHGRSEGRFFGLVYVQATNYTLKFDHRSGMVKATSWLVNPTPGTNNKPQTDVYRRTSPRSQASDEREGETGDQRIADWREPGIRFAVLAGSRAIEEQQAEAVRAQGAQGGQARKGRDVGSGGRQGSAAEPCAGQL